MARTEAFYNFAQDVSTSEADLGLLQLMNELRAPQGLSYSREQSNSEGMMWPQSANFDRPAQSSSAQNRASRPALDQGLDDWVEQGLRLSFEEAALHHMRYIVEEQVEFAEESRQHFLQNGAIPSMSGLRRVPLPSELGPADVPRKPPVNLVSSRSARQPDSRDFAVSIAPKSLHAAFYNYIQNISRGSADKTSAVLQLVQSVRDPHAWVCSPPESEVPGSFRALLFEHLAEVFTASLRVSVSRALLPLRRFYPSAGQPCLVRVIQAYEPGPADGNHLRLQVGDLLSVDSEILDVPGFCLGRLHDQPRSAAQAFPAAHTKLLRDVAHFAVAASEASAAVSIPAGNDPRQDYLHGIEVSNRLLSASIARLSLLYSQRKATDLGSLKLDGRRSDAIPYYLALRAHSNFNDFSSLLAINYALEPVVNVLRMRLEPSARMTPAHAHAHTTSVDLLIQRVVGLSPRAAMTDDLIALCNIAIGGKEALQNLLINLYAPIPIIGGMPGTPPPFSFVETLWSIKPPQYPQFFEMVINEIVWLHLICCSPIVPVCQVCPSDSSQAFLWQSSLRSIHTHFVETLQHSITGSQPHHSQPPSLRAVYFAPDLSMHKDEMDPRNRLSTDVWANIDHVLRQLWGSLYDFNFSQGNPPFCNERREASIDNALRKYVTPSLRAGALVLCQHLPEAARILEEGNLPLDACVLSCIFDVAGLCPRFERKDGPCVGAAGYTIKAFSSRINPPGSSLLPTGQDSTIDLCSYLALALDSSHNLSLPLQTIMPSSNISIQLLAFIFVHLHRSHQTGAIFSFPLERAVQQRLDPSRAQTISISGGCKYLEAVCNFAAKYFEEDTKGDPLHLVEAARMYKYSKNFEKFSEMLIQAIVCCIPLPHQYGAAHGAAATAALEALRAEVAAVLKFEVVLASPTDSAFMSWCVVGGVANSRLQYLSQLVSVAYAFEISRQLPFNAAATLEALQSGPPSSVLDWSKSMLPELRRTPSSCFSHRDPSCLSLIPVDAVSVAALADAFANSEGAHFTQLLASRVGSTCLLLLDALKAQPPALQRAAREQAQVCNDFLNALMLNHTISADVANAGAAKFSELFK